MLSRLSAACDAALPNEACGLLLGWRAGDAVWVADIASPSGAAGTFDGFEIPDHEIARAKAYAADNGLVIVAVFHSHPSGSSDLSERDLAAIRFSEWPWLLLTGPPTKDQPSLRAFAPVSAEPIVVEQCEMTRAALTLRSAMANSTDSSWAE